MTISRQVGKTGILFLIVGFLIAPSSVQSEGGICPRVVGEAVVYKEGNHIRVTNIFGFDTTKPDLYSDLMVLPYPKGVPVALKIISVRKESSGEYSWWVVSLEDASKSLLKDLKPLGPPYRNNLWSAVVLWPSPRKIPSIVKHNPKDLPKGVFSNTVKAAVDLDNDGKADALLVEFDCEDRQKNTLHADSNCGETWQKLDGKWILCDSITPD